MIGRKDRALLIRALQVLAQFGEGEVPSRRDMIILRRHVGPKDADLPIDEVCCLLIRRESGAMTRAETRSLQRLAGQTAHLASLRDQQRITEAEYTDRLNNLRQQYGLCPIHFRDEA